MIKVRRYSESDIPALWEIFYHTIRNINIRDYSRAQVEAWAPDNFDQAIWQRKMHSIAPYVAVLDGEIVGYTDLQDDGLIDHFFCHHQYQGRGIGKIMMEHVFEQGKLRGISKFHSEVSITARPFYEKQGFCIVEEQVVNVRGQKLRNFLMESHQ
ncbi:GNAT family N-acetyltransferase [Vibrio sp. CAIM 722]|uniref:GNAT family N-acetyltransferase n=1 Tax=Vibrio eleionomae TaxID=2653505 RepID=A0A7X4LPF9_9VIBR|nr:GNAT family N-acetyltransferase [Vibrio eleionomae]MZI95758.1 GNAT family N-acetyltransferase [Vibrio eleionomae]